MHPHAEPLKKVGLTTVKRALGIPSLTTVASWCERGVAYKHRHKVLELLRAHGAEVPETFLEEPPINPPRKSGG